MILLSQWKKWWVSLLLFLLQLLLTSAKGEGERECGRRMFPQIQALTRAGTKDKSTITLCDLKVRREEGR